MATDASAVRARDGRIKGAWMKLGVSADNATAALKRGSGAVQWLVEHTDPPPLPAPASAAAGSPPAAATKAARKDPAVPAKRCRIVVQRCTTASLLVDNVDTYVTVGHGLIVYVSFYAACEAKQLAGIAKRVLGAEFAVLPSGVERWDGKVGGEGGRAISIVAAGLAGGPGQPAHVLVIPQACLVSKLKGSASKPKLQYHGQASPAVAKGLYAAFVAALRTEGAALVAKQRGGAADADEAGALIIECGTFGYRQALRAEMPGPFTHTLEF